jgi:hypothetical protein
LGSTVWVIGNCNDHGYVLGKPYVVVEIDDDGTFRARDPHSGMVGNWLRWQDVDIRPPIGWDSCKKVLPPEIVRFLEAFDGIESITLRESVKQRMLARVPQLYEAISAAQEELAVERPIPGELPANRPRADDTMLSRYFDAADQTDTDEELVS